MACHDQIALRFSDGVFFAYPGRPWERPSNENTNGLLRQYSPKRTDLSIHSAENLKAVEQLRTPLTAIRLRLENLQSDPSAANRCRHREDRRQARHALSWP